MKWDYSTKAGLPWELLNKLFMELDGRESSGRDCDNPTPSLYPLSLPGHLAGNRYKDCQYRDWDFRSHHTLSCRLRTIVRTEILESPLTFLLSWVLLFYLSSWLQSVIQALIWFVYPIVNFSIVLSIVSVMWGEVCEVFWWAPALPSQSVSHVHQQYAESYHTVSE